MPNGPVWYEADEAPKYGIARQASTEGMKGDAWEGGHRMPFAMRWPARIQGGQITNQLACHTNLFAPCASIVGHELRTDAAENSIDLPSGLTGIEKEFLQLRETLILNFTGDLLNVRKGR